MYRTPQSEPDHQHHDHMPDHYTTDQPTPGSHHQFPHDGQIQSDNTEQRGKKQDHQDHRLAREIRPEIKREAGSPDNRTSRTPADRTTTEPSNGNAHGRGTGQQHVDHDHTSDAEQPTGTSEDRQLEVSQAEELCDDTIHANPEVNRARYIHKLAKIALRAKIEKKRRIIHIMQQTTTGIIVTKRTTNILQTLDDDIRTLRQEEKETELLLDTALHVTGPGAGTQSCEEIDPSYLQDDGELPLKKARKDDTNPKPQFVEVKDRTEDNYLWQCKNCATRHHSNYRRIC